MLINMLPIVDDCDCDCDVCEKNATAIRVLQYRVSLAEGKHAALVVDVDTLAKKKVCIIL